MHIHDDAPRASNAETVEPSGVVDTSSWYGGIADFEDFKQQLRVGNPPRDVTALH